MPAMKDRGTAFWFVSYYLFERVGETDSFHLMFDSSSGYNSQG